MKYICYLLVALTAPATAFAQPYSESMADCASQFQNAAQWVQNDENSEKLMAAARVWADAALVQARQEGQRVSKEDIWTKIDRKTELNEAKGRTYFVSQDWRDWMSYCRSFGKDRGITYEP